MLSILAEIQGIVGGYVLGFLTILGITAFLMLSIVPKFKDVFASMDIELPALTLGVLAVATKNELLSLIIFGIFFLEAISVIIQRYYYKATKRRIFLMAPIHHHFEKKNWSEAQIVVRFWIIAIMLSLFALASLKLR